MFSCACPERLRKVDDPFLFIWEPLYNLDSLHRNRFDLRQLEGKWVLKWCGARRLFVGLLNSGDAFLGDSKDLGDDNHVWTFEVECLFPHLSCFDS